MDEDPTVSEEINPEDPKPLNYALILFSVLISGLSAGFLTLYPGFVPYEWVMPAYGLAGITTFLAFALWMQNAAEKKRQEEREIEERMEQRAERRAQEREEELARVQERKKQAEEREAQAAAQRAERKSELVAQAKTLWAERAEMAQKHEHLARQIVEKAAKASVKEAAGYAAAEWSTAASNARWTSEQILLLTDRQDVKIEARQEAQEMAIEAERIRKNSGVWTKAQGDKLLKLKERARAEAKAEEERQDAVQELVQKAERDWSIAESRALRAEQALKDLAENKS